MQQLLLLTIILGLSLGLKSLSAQQAYVDSLKNMLAESVDDTNKVHLLNKLAWTLRRTNFEKALGYANESLDLSGRLNFHRGKATAYNYLGIIYQKKGEYSISLDYLFQSLALEDSLNNRRGVANVYNNIGLIYDYQRNYQKALEYYFKALDIRKALKDSRGVALAYNNIGIAYYYMDSLEIVLEYFKKALKIREKDGNPKEQAQSYGNIGEIYNELGQYAKAAYYLEKAMAINEKTEDKLGMSIALISLSNLYAEQHKYQKAMEYLDKSIRTSRSLGAKEPLRAAYESKSRLYSQLNDYKQALTYYQKHADLKDSLLNKENSEKINQLQVSYEAEKKEQAIALLTKDKEIQQRELNRQKIMRNVFIGGFILFFIMAFILFNRYQIKRRANLQLTRANHIIEVKNKTLEEANTAITQQKDIIERKNQHITNSIQYAQRIQQAILPEREEILRMLPESFVLFKPKDIVSGDFFWFTQKNQKTLIAAADCTGHGVPGAFMSMIGTALLNETVGEKGITRPAEILDHLRAGIIASLKQKGTMGEQKDGMDIAICALDQATMTLEYAGAYNPLYLIRKQAPLSKADLSAESSKKTLPHKDTTPMEPKADTSAETSGNNFPPNEFSFMEVKADKQPIGIHYIKKPGPFTNHKISLEKGDTIYLFSDGYVDQFGGSFNRKFTNKRLKDLLLASQHLDMPAQESLLDQEFERWKGEHEQIDDICIIGIRIS